MTIKDDHSIIQKPHHVRPISNRKEQAHLQELPPNAYCRRHSSAFRNLLETHPDIAALITKRARRKSPRYGRSGRVPISEIHREMCMALRAKGLTGSDYPFSTQTLARSAFTRFVNEVRYGDFKQVVKDCADSLKQNIARSGNLSATRKVLGNRDLGQRGYIQLIRVRYSSVRLANTPSLIGTRVVLSVDRNNRQKISAFLESGQFFDCLEPTSSI